MNNFHEKSVGEKSFDVFNIIILTLLALVTLYPLYYVLVASLSSPSAIAEKGTLMFWPNDFTIDAYKAVFSNDMIAIGYRNTLFYVIIGTSINLVLTTLTAYGLSRKWLAGRKIIMKFIVITMFFSGGMIPSFLIVQELGLYNTPWALMIPNAIAAWNVIMMRTYFMTSIPDALEESAKIDGANDFQILWKVVLPCSKPIIMVMLLFYAVGHWNSWFGASIYLQQRDYWPLQLVLREVLIQGSIQGSDMVNSGAAQLFIAKNIKYATVMVATVPILCVYPFIQKYFVQGVMIGSIKE